MKFYYVFYWLLMILFISCQCDTETFVFTETETEFVPYQLNEVIRYKNLQTDEIKEFVVVKDSIYQYEEGGSSAIYPKFCQGNSDDTFEERSFTLESGDCVLEYTISTEGLPVSLNFFIFDCDISISGGTLNGELPLLGDGNYDLDGTVYSPVYRLENAIREILITPELGVFTFIDEITQQRYVLVD